MAFSKSGFFKAISIASSIESYFAILELMLCKPEIEPPLYDNLMYTFIISSVVSALSTGLVYTFENRCKKQTRINPLTDIRTDLIPSSTIEPIPPYKILTRANLFRGKISSKQWFGFFKKTR